LPLLSFFLSPASSSCRGRDGYRGVDAFPERRCAENIDGEKGTGKREAAEKVGKKWEVRMKVGKVAKSNSVDDEDISRWRGVGKETLGERNASSSKGVPFPSSSVDGGKKREKSCTHCCLCLYVFLSVNM
jgi:hypothetical protein